MISIHVIFTTRDAWAGASSWGHDKNSKSGAEPQHKPANAFSPPTKIMSGKVPYKILTNMPLYIYIWDTFGCNVFQEISSPAAIRLDASRASRVCIECSSQSVAEEPEWRHAKWVEGATSVQNQLVENTTSSTSSWNIMKLYLIQSHLSSSQMVGKKRVGHNMLKEWNLLGRLIQLDREDPTSYKNIT